MTEERTIEDLARTLCAALGVDPDRPIVMGVLQQAAGKPGRYLHDYITPAWVQYIHEAGMLGLPVRMRDQWSHWIDRKAVVRFKLVPMTLDDLYAEERELRKAEMASAVAPAFDTVFEPGNLTFVRDRDTGEVRFESNVDDEAAAAAIERRDLP